MTTSKRFVTGLAACAVASSLSVGVSAANIVLNNVDPPGVGLNDPTPATPVGGNDGTCRAG